MKIEPGSKGMFILHASDHELTIINNALNEICNGTFLHDFDARIGATQAEAKVLLGSVNQALNETNWS